MSYFVLVVGINQESLAERRLREKGFEVYYPVGRKTVRHARREFDRIFPVFSRYIFVKCHDVWGEMLDADGVIDILKNNFKPLTVSQDIIDDLKDREKSGKFNIIPPKRGKPKWMKSFELLKNLLNVEPIVT